MEQGTLEISACLIKRGEPFVHVGRPFQVTQFLGLQERRSKLCQTLGLAPGGDQVIAMLQPRLNFAQAETAARRLRARLLQIGQAAGKIAAPAASRAALRARRDRR